MKKRIFLAFLATMYVAAPAWAYKEIIHRVISMKAFDRMTVDLKAKTGYELTAPVGGQSLRVLVGQGAYDQDAGLNALNHFYDPAHAAALTVPLPGCVPVGQSARIWASLGLDNPHSTPSARTFLQQALFLPTKAAREEALRKTFLNLGHSIHLVQDMAQPEHTRNDQHLTMPVIGGLLTDAPQPSLYEEWGLANLLGVFPSVSYDGYPNVSLDSTFDYFSNGSSQGLAQFANASFVTQDTNYSDTTGKCFYYGDPDVGAAVPRTVVVDEAIRDAAGNISTLRVLERIYTSFPRDRYTGATETDPNHTFLSVVDLETREVTGPTYSLADQSYLTRASMLIPRAVGYSAGYLDHFFRGSIAVTWQQAGDSNPRRYNIEVKNTSSETIEAGARVTIGYVAGAKYIRSTDGSDMVLILNDSLPALPPGVSVIFADVAIPYLREDDDVRAFERHIAVRGTLGDEFDDIITLVQPKEQTENGIRARITWDNAETTVHLYVISDTHFVWNTTVHDVCDNWTVINIPGTTMNSLPIGSTGPILFKMPSPPADLKLRFVCWIYKTYRECRTPGIVAPTTTVRLELYKDGQFLTENNVVATHEDSTDGYPIGFGAYPVPPDPAP